jgi:hypothetical protein
MSEAEIDATELDEMVCVGCGESVLDEGGDETLGWLGGDEGWFCPTCVEPSTPPEASGSDES